MPPPKARRCFFSPVFEPCGRRDRRPALFLPWLPMLLPGWAPASRGQTSTVVLTVLHSFNGSDGTGPDAGLIQGSDGNFSGTTILGGATGGGTLFRLTAAGALTVLHNFDGSDGNAPYARLLVGSDGNLYSTTSSGGPNSAGSIFQVTPARDP